jgi:hypothetical protein
MTKPYIDALKRLETPGGQRAVMESMFGSKRAGAPAPKAPAPRAEVKKEDPEAQLAAKVRELDAARQRYLAAIEMLGTHLEERPHDPTEVVELALVVAEAIIGRAFASDHNLMVERVTEALDSLDGERPTRLRLSPSDKKLLADERPELLARALEVIEDPKLQPGGCIVEGARRGVDATIEEKLARFSRVLKQRLAEDADE